MVRLWMNGQQVDSMAIKTEADYEVASAPDGTKATLEWSKSGPRVVVNMAVGDLQTVVIRKIENK